MLRPRQVGGDVQPLVGGTRVSAVHRGVGIDPSRPLLPDAESQRAIGVQRWHGRGQQPVLDLVGGQTWAAGQHERYHAGNLRCAHGGAAQLVVVLVDLLVGVVLGQLAFVRHQPHHARPRGYQVGFDEALIGRAGR